MGPRSGKPGLTALFRGHHMHQVAFLQYACSVVRALSSLSELLLGLPGLQHVGRRVCRSERALGMFLYLAVLFRLSSGQLSLKFRQLGKCKEDSIKTAS